VDNEWRIKVGQTQIQLQNVEPAINGDVYLWILKGEQRGKGVDTATDTVIDTVCENPTEPATAVMTLVNNEGVKA
jgi:hypothetical protein